MARRFLCRGGGDPEGMGGPYFYPSFTSGGSILRPVPFIVFRIGRGPDCPYRVGALPGGKGHVGGHRAALAGSRTC